MPLTLLGRLDPENTAPARPLPSHLHSLRRRHRRPGRHLRRSASGTQAVNTDGVSSVVWNEPEAVPPGGPGRRSACTHRPSAFSPATNTVRRSARTTGRLGAGGSSPRFRLRRCGAIGWSPRAARRTACRSASSGAGVHRPHRSAEHASAIACSSVKVRPLARASATGSSPSRSRAQARRWS